MILNPSAKPLKNTCKEICILESFSVSMNKIYEIHLWKNYFFSIYHTPGYVYDCLQYTTLKRFDITFSKPPSRNFVIIHQVYNEDEIIYFLYIFILIYIYHTHTERDIYRERVGKIRELPNHIYIYIHIYIYNIYIYICIQIYICIYISILNVWYMYYNSRLQTLGWHMYKSSNELFAIGTKQ